jgi:kinesin family protein 2/24
MSVERDFSVVFRLRPLLQAPGAEQQEPLVTVDEGAAAGAAGTHTAVVSQERKSWKHGETAEQHRFAAHRVYGCEAQTDELFDEHVAPLVPFALDGGYATVLAYGQTASGKTHTLSHCSAAAARVLSAANAARRPGGKGCRITISCIEIYGKTVNDLLDAANKRAAVAEDMQGRGVLARVTEREVTTEQEILTAMEQAWALRRTSATAKNAQSSRSHALIRLTLAPEGDANATPGVLQLVDLAGSERAAGDSASHSSERMAETVAINTSLMALKECMRARSGGAASVASAKHIPFRSTKLTLALKEAFDLFSRQPATTVFIATASTAAADISATLNTFRYASALLLVPQRLVVQEPDPRDVTYWSNARVLEWLAKYGGAALVRPQDVAPYEDGLALSRVPEADFMARLQRGSDGALQGESARRLYLKWWRIVIASRTLAKEARAAEWKRTKAAAAAASEAADAEAAREILADVQCE